MSEREGKEKRIKTKISLKALYTVIIIAEILIVVLCSSGIVELIHALFEDSKKLPNIVWIAMIGALLAIISGIFFAKFISRPIRMLQKALKQVSDGDFSVRLSDDHGFEEMKQINSSFNSMTKELAATEILQTDFVSNVSHEFKTPINAIEGYATLLQGTDDPEEQKKYVEKILFNTERLSALVGNILLLSKIDNQGIHGENKKYRLDEQIRQSILSLEPRWIRRECEFDVELDEVEYCGNESLMMHVWNNLIENAIKFGPEGGLIKIYLTESEDKITFTVEDEGEGIPEESASHIFDRFYQSDSSHKSEGNGLGLSLVSRILTIAGGEIDFKNVDAGGARFTVILNK